MRWKNTTARFGAPSALLHWLMLVLLAAVCAAMELKSIFPKGSTERAAMAAWHYGLGLSVFALVWLRLLVRLVGANPVIAPPLPPWQATLATVSHAALYALMIALPIVGWLTLSARGTPPLLFGIEVPALIGKSKSLAEALKELHEALAGVGYALVGLHAVAALYHHYVRRDNTLRLMAFGTSS